jgi:NAD(P) transhydrogenase subunit alpha
LSVFVETGAGLKSSISDDAYRAKGAELGDRARVFACDVVAKVAPPSDAEVALMRSGTSLISFLSPLDEPQRCQALASAGISALSMELVPRISRAQKMDALSAMANIAGYKAVLLAAVQLPRYFPLLTTAAGTVKPANVLVLGAGVAGLQAIATARRLGARVSAYDIRDAVKEQVESLGASFVELELETREMEDKSGYAKALDEEKARRQTELLVPAIAKSDVVISTALIPGRRAPILITGDAVDAMKPGSVIVDLAAPNGGNCERTVPGETTVTNGVSILAPLNVPATVAAHASELYARTIMEMLLEMMTEEGIITVDLDNDIIGGSCVTSGGKIVNERVAGLLSKSQ